MTRTPAVAALLAACVSLAGPRAPTPQTSDTIVIRGHAQTVRLYGVRGRGDPLIVCSGDGGWIHLAPHVADLLAARGAFVVGFDSRAYLASFTSGVAGVQPRDEPGDFRALADYATRGSRVKPVIIGVSEGAGLAVLAATDPRTREALAGVVGLGLPDINELGWRWRDAIIYLTHAVPREPTFSTAAIVSRMAPLPLAAIHATRDEFVPLGEVQRILKEATGPSRLWIIDASNHRFSDRLPEFDAALVEAVTWVRAHAPR